MIYLDSASSSRDYTCSKYWAIGNPHSIHKNGLYLKKHIKILESTIKKIFNGKDGTLFWTGSGSQANSLAITAASTRNMLFQTSSIEHKSILQHQTGLFVPWNPDKHCQIKPQNTIHKDTKLLSIQLVNNEVGSIQDIKSIFSAAKQFHPKLITHTDAVQGMGKINIDVEDMNVDMLTFSPHKFNGPSGIGCLWIRNSILDDLDIPYLGTPSVDLIRRTSAALVLAVFEMEEEYRSVSEKRGKFLKNVRHASPWLVTVRENCIPHILSIQFKGIDNDELAMNLSDKEVMISTGSACSSRKKEPSHVLLAMGKTTEEANSTIRVSFGKDVTIDECKEAARVISETVKEIKNGY